MKRPSIIFRKSLVFGSLFSIISTVLFSFIGFDEYLSGYFSCTIFWIICIYYWENKLNMNILEEIKQQIEQEGLKLYPPMDNSHDPFCHERELWVAGATAYAARAITAEQRVKELEQWQQESLLVIDPIIEWGQAQKDIPVGNSISSEVLRMAKLFTVAKQENERLRKALEIVQKWQLPSTGQFWDDDKTKPVSYEACYGSNGARDFMRSVANEALTYKPTTNE